VSPRLARYYASARIADYNRMLLRLVGLVVLVGFIGIAGALLLGKPLLTLLYSEQYEPYAGLLVWVMVFSAFTNVASILGYAMTSARYFKIQPYLFACLTACNFASLSWLVPRLELEGVVFALTITAIVQIAATLLVIRHAIRKNKQAAVQFELAKEGG